MDRSAKQAFVQDFSEKLSRAQLAIVTDYRGVDANSMVEFRKKVRAVEGAEFQVVKNRLMKLALADTSFSSLESYFDGTNAVLLGYADVVEAAKVITEFAKDNDKLALKGGSMQGKPLTNAEIAALADLPPKQVLQAQLLGVLQAPSRNLVSVLANVNRQILNVLSAYKAKLEDGE
ncbi:MAG: 50S ribosomal protein L10 [Proteobacteria bacterium]|nr:50S ribosomal protein L10 [Pseudomonadota bacterium]